MKKTTLLYILSLIVYSNYLFAQTKNCYIWVKDHWERPKANVQYKPGELQCFDGTPPDGAKGGVTVQDNRGKPNSPRTFITIQETATEKNYILKNLNDIRDDDQELWNKAVSDQLGIIGNDFKGLERIGSACFQRATSGSLEATLIPDNLNFWYPQKQVSNPNTSLKYYKRTIVGTIDAKNEPEVQNINDIYNDYDVNIFIKPDKKYKYLIDEGHKPELSNKEALKNILKSASGRKPWQTTTGGCPDKFDGVELEIDNGKEPNQIWNNLAKKRLNKPMAAYGAWIWDEGHCHQPEIHPAEQMWWMDEAQNKKQYTFAVSCDASKRFWYRDQMDDGEKLKPWGAPPIKGEFAIAFEVNIGNGLMVNSGEQKIFEVSDISNKNVRNYLKTDNINNNKVHNLTYMGRDIVTFIPHNNSFKVKFENIGLVPNTTIIKGFLVIETEVGTCVLKNKQVINISGTINLADDADPNKVPQSIERQAFEKIDGHYYFKITETTTSNTQAMEVKK